MKKKRSTVLIIEFRNKEKNLGILPPFKNEHTSSNIYTFITLEKLKETK